MRIARIDVFPLRGRDASGPYGAPYALLVKVTTDAGLVGWGETDSHPALAAAAIRAPMLNAMTSGLAPLLLGTPADPRAAWERMCRGTVGHSRDGIVRHAMAAIDIALWDIAGKAAGRPLSDLLGGRRRDRLRVYATHPLGDTPAASARFAEALAAEGFTAVKFGWAPLGADPAGDTALVAALRAAVGPDVALLIDGGMAWDLAAAKDRAARFAPYRLHWLEEPLPAYDLAAYAALRAAAPMPIAAGEMAATAAELGALVAAGGVGVLQIDVSRTGLTEALRIAAAANAAGVPCVNHSYSCLLNTAASLHLCAVIAATDLFEVQAPGGELRDALAAGQLAPRGGTITVPEGPGLGVEVDEGVVRHFLDGA